MHFPVENAQLVYKAIEYYKYSNVFNILKAM